MAITAIGVISLVLNVVFLIVITWFIIKFFELKKQVKRLIKELENDSLEHYLKKIKEKGFDVAVKPGKGK